MRRKMVNAEKRCLSLHHSLGRIHVCEHTAKITGPAVVGKIREIVVADSGKMGADNVRAHIVNLAEPCRESLPG